MATPGVKHIFQEYEADISLEDRLHVGATTSVPIVSTCSLAPRGLQSHGCPIQDELAGTQEGR